MTIWWLIEGTDCLRYFVLLRYKLKTCQSFIYALAGFVYKLLKVRYVGQIMPNWNTLTFVYNLHTGQKEMSWRNG